MAPADNALLVPAAAHGDDAKDVAHVISSSTTASSPAKEQQEAVPAAAMLLGRGITEPCAPVVKVKNTFIDGFDDEDDDDELPMCAAKSLPAFRTPFSLRSPTGAAPPMTLNPVHEGLDASETSRAVMYWQPDPAGARPADASRAELLEQTLHPQQHEQPQPQEPQQQQPQQQQQQQQPQQQQQQQQQQQEQVYKDHQQQQQQRGPASVAVTAFEARKPEWSLGSDVHGTGECRPCAWFWRPQGCTNGGDCRHCHLCPAGEVKARRKNKLASLRKATRETAAEE